MSKIIESLQNLSVENDKKSHKQVNGKTCRKNELILLMEESASSEQNYILSVCGTQRQLSNFLTETSHIKSAQKQI